MKEYYFYLDSTPTHSYMKYLYKYPQAEYPYQQLVEENRRRAKSDPEFELLDTGVFDEDRYFDVFVEYAKADAGRYLYPHHRGQSRAGSRGAPSACRRCGFATPGPGAGEATKPRWRLDRKTGTILAQEHEIGDYRLHSDDGGQRCCSPKTKPTSNDSSARKILRRM